MDKKTAEELGYSNLKYLGEDRGLCGLYKMGFTTGLFVDIEEYCYEGRYCYEHWDDAAKALADWDGVGDPGGDWIKAKFYGLPDRHGPGSNVPIEHRREYEYTNF